MNKISSKYWCICTTFIIFVGLLNSGCFQMKKPSFLKKESSGEDDRINSLEEKLANLTYSMGNLTTENYELKKNFSQLEEIKSKLNKEYTQIKNKQIAIEKTRTEDKNERNRLKKELTETKISLNEIKQHLTIIESEKSKLKEKLEKIESRDVQTKQIDEPTIPKKPAVDDTIEVEAKESDPDQSNKNIIKETREKMKSSLVEGLLNKAIKLYREGSFEEAIAKWEEVMVLDPSKLEAKFNIEIARDRIKEKQIQEDLKSNRTQRE